MRDFMNNTTNIENTGLGVKSYDNKITTSLVFSLIFAVLMAISANSFVYLPFTPVPITMQVLTVLLSGIFLGSRWALASQTIYVFMGLMGLPVFSGFKNGAIALAGPTVGYIAGFMVAAFVTGYLYENSGKRINNNPLRNLFDGFISCLAGVVVIHLFGFIYLFGYLFSLTGTQSISDTLSRTWKLGTQPFIAIDFLKILIALSILNLNKIKK